tara:strand:+ start:131 stop:517 length:387 start_codon:yes stop_codon:yes gene_type:complete
MGGNMPYDDFIDISHRITKGKTSIKRPNTHPLCPNSFCKAKKKHFPTFATQQRSKGGNIDEELFNEITELPCFYCREKPAMGIDRISNSSGYYFPYNVVPCCSLCNFVKGRYTTNFFLKHMSKISNRH